jgi:hypothetical protein
LFELVIFDPFIGSFLPKSINYRFDGQTGTVNISSTLFSLVGEPDMALCFSLTCCKLKNMTLSGLTGEDILTNW